MSSNGLLLGNGNALNTELNHYLTKGACRNNSNSQYPHLKDPVHALFIIETRPFYFK